MPYAESASELRHRADRYRRLAVEVSDERAHQSCLALADQCEQRAREIGFGTEAELGMVVRSLD